MCFARVCEEVRDRGVFLNEGMILISFPSGLAFIFLTHANLRGLLTKINMRSKIILADCFKSVIDVIASGAKQSHLYIIGPNALRLPGRLGSSQWWSRLTCSHC